MAHCNIKSLNIIMNKAVKNKSCILNTEIKIFILFIGTHTTHKYTLFSAFTLHTSVSLWKLKMVNKLQRSICKIQSQITRSQLKERRNNQKEKVVLVGKSFWSMFSVQDIGVYWDAEAGWFSSNCKPIRHNHSQRTKQDHGIIYLYRTLSKSQTPGEKTFIFQKVTSAPFFPKSHKNCYDSYTKPWHIGIRIRSTYSLAKYHRGTF